MSLQHIGSGEGNQVYGYGINSAEARDTAEFYRKSLIGKTLGNFDVKEHVTFTNEDGRYTFKDGTWTGQITQFCSPSRISNMPRPIACDPLAQAPETVRFIPLNLKMHERFIVTVEFID